MRVDLVSRSRYKSSASAKVQRDTGNNSEQQQILALVFGNAADQPVGTCTCPTWLIADRGVAMMIPNYGRGWMCVPGIPGISAHISTAPLVHYCEKVRTPLAWPWYYSIFPFLLDVAIYGIVAL